MRRKPRPAREAAPLRGEMDRPRFRGRGDGAGSRSAPGRDGAAPLPGPGSSGFRRRHFLLPEDALVETGLLNEGVVGSDLGEAPVFEDEDAIAMAGGGDALGDDEGGMAGEDFFEGGADFGLGFGVECAGGVVEQEDFRVGQEGRGEGEALFLACEARETGQASQPGTKTILSLASGVREQWLWDFFPDAWEETDIAVWDDSQQQVVRRQSLSCLGIVLEEKLRQDPDPEAAAEILACLLDDGKLALPGWDDDVERWIARVRWLAEMFPEQGLPSYDESDRAKVHRLLCAGETSYRAVKNKECLAAVRQLLPRSQVQFVEAMAPAQVMLPNGRRMRLEYTPGQAPKGRSRIQDFYDMVETPRVAGGAVPVLLDILAPNYRTVQITDDLKRFWDVHYPRIKPELARRYPRHVWR